MPAALSAFFPFFLQHLSLRVVHQKTHKPRLSYSSPEIIF